MNFDGDAIRRKDGVTIVSIEQDGDDQLFFIVNYQNGGNIGYAKLDTSYIIEYTESENVSNLEITHPLHIEIDDKDYPKWQKEYMTKITEGLQNCLIYKKKLNLVIETVTKGCKVAYIRRIEFI